MYFTDKNEYNDIREKSLMQWLDEMEKHPDVAVRGGVKLSFTDGLILHHGSYCEVKDPDLAKYAKRKDFGQGFKTGDTIECLKFVEGKKIWLK